MDGLGGGGRGVGGAWCVTLLVYGHEYTVMTYEYYNDVSRMGGIEVVGGGRRCVGGAWCVTLLMYGHECTVTSITMMYHAWVA